METRPYPWTCPRCRQREVYSDVVDYTTTIEHDGRSYTVKVPSLEVPKCRNCGKVVMVDSANRRISEAFRREAGLLTPEEIRAGRVRCGLDQQTFADLLGISVSTLSRWETGAQIQQRSLNRLMEAYFASPEVREVYGRLSERDTGEHRAALHHSRRKPMQRTIFALWGIGDSGKTTTISLVYDHFRQQGATVIYRGDYARRRQKGATEIKGAVLEIDGVLVGFASPGDRPDILSPLLKDLIERGCIIIVCATHTRGGTVEVVRGLGRQGFKVEWIEKACPQVNHEDGNRKKATEIIEKVREAVENARLVEA